MADLIPLPEFYKPNMDFVLHTLKESLFPANYSSVLLHSADTMFYRLQCARALVQNVELGVGVHDEFWVVFPYSPNPKVHGAKFPQNLLC